MTDISSALIWGSIAVLIMAGAFLGAERVLKILEKIDGR